MDAAQFAGMNLPASTVNAPYNASVANIDAFQMAMNKAEMGSTAAPAESSTLKAMTVTLEKLNLESKVISEKASEFGAKGAAMTPGEMVMMTVRCHEFMFHCQLTSNVANRTSDGIQQLFRQQS
jgi:hypothetical protein